MQLDKIKRMAAELLKVGKQKVWLNPDEMDKISESMTKEDVRELIRKGLIKKRKEKESSRGRARKLHEQRKKGRRRSSGKRRGSKKARVKEKKRWMRNVRAQRKKLSALREAKEKMKLPYSRIYMMIKGNYFKGKRYMEAFAREEKK